MSARSVECVLSNNNALVGLRRMDGGSLDHGEYTTEPPAVGAVVAPNGSATWVAESCGFMTGTEGTVIFEVVDGQTVVGKFTLYWDNPFVGTNSCSQHLELADEAAFKAAYGNPYMDEKCEVINVDGSTNHLRVAYIFSVTRPAGAESADGGAPGAKPGAAAADPDAPHEVTAQPGQTACASGVAPTSPPRLIMALTKATPSRPGTDGSTEGILKTVAARLEAGLDEVWQQGECALWDPNVWKKDDDDEKWARALTELLLGQPYMTPEVAFSGSQVSLHEIYKQFNNPDDPKIGVTSECQHLVTYAELSRGYALEEEKQKADAPKGIPSSGFGCSSAESCPLFKTENHGAWYKDPGVLDIQTALKKDIPLSPASVVAINEDSTGATQSIGHPHTYFILRVDRKGQRSAQLFDTGGASRGGPIPDATSAAFGALGLYDNENVDKLDQVDGYLGLGVPPKDEAVLKKMVPLADRIAQLKKTRRIGLARLVIAKPGCDFKDPTADVEYVSPLVRMWGDDPAQNFGYGHFLWSLRELGAKDKEVWWVFYAPRMGLANKLYKSARADKPSALKEFTMANTMIVGAVSSKTDGQAVFRLRIHAKAGETETTYDGDGQIFKLIFILSQNKKTRAARKGDLLALYPAFNRFLNSIAAEKSYPAGNTISAPPLFTP